MFTHRYQCAVPALLPRRPAVPQVRVAARGPRAPLHRLVAALRGLPVLIRPLGLGLQTSLVQGERLLSLQLQSLQRRVLIAVLAAVVVPPKELDSPA